MKYVSSLLLLALACQGAPADAPSGQPSADGGSAAGPRAEAPSTAGPASESPSAGGPTAGAGASPEPTDAAQVVPPRGPTMVERYDLETRAGRFDLPGRLDEISGLAFTGDGRLFGHDDERARLHEIDPATGAVGKSFDLGDDLVRGDFEGIAIAGERFFLVTSVGMLYEFREGADGSDVPFRVTDLELGSCEVEGLDHDMTDDALLVACKVTRDPENIVVHRIALDPARGALPPLMIQKAHLMPLGLGTDFDPSGVVVDPAGTILLVSGRYEKLIEVTRNGEVVSGVQLSRGRHPQPEGIEIAPDGALLVADEKNGQDPRLTRYDLRPPEGAE